MSDDWGELATNWDNGDTRLYAERAFESFDRKVVPLFADLANSRILDFGCGTRLLTEKIAPFCGSIVAVDSSSGMIEVLRRKVADNHYRNVTPLVASSDLATTSGLSVGFHLVVTFSVCSFLPDYESTLCNLSSVIRSGEIFAQWDWLSEMPVGRIQRAFKTAGLINHDIETVFEMTVGDESMSVVLGIASHL